MKMTYKILFATALIGAFVLFGLGGKASAATIMVTTTDDEQWTNPATCSLREAISSANVDDSGSSGCATGAGDDVIVVPAGTYELENYIEIFAVHEGPSYWPGNITIRGDAGGGTIISGGDNMTPVNDALVLFRLIEDASIERTITFENIDFRNNHDTDHVIMQQSASGSELILKNITASGFNKEAISIIEGSDSDAGFGNVTIENSLIQNGGGGVIMGYLADCLEGPGGLLSIYNSIIQGHNATNLPGGIGVWCTSLTLDSVTIADNHSVQGTGGVYIKSHNLGNTPRFEITNTTFASNTSDSWAGGLAVDNFTESWNHGRAHGFIRNSTFANNQGNSDWAGDNQIIAWTSGEPFEMSSVLFSQGASTADACAIFDNNGDSIQLSDGSHNLSYDQSCSEDFVTGNPALLPLADNGGGSLIGAGGQGGNILTMTFDPEISAAFNTGNPTTCPATDARGIARPQGSSCDIGAVEIGVPVVDLSLKAIIKPGQPAPKPGQSLALLLEVTNEGNTPVHSYDISGHIPEQFTLQDGGWTETAGVAITTIDIPILPDQTQQTEINFLIKPDASGSVLASFEISEMRDSLGQVLGDSDSTPGNEADDEDDIFSLNIALGLASTGTPTLILGSVATVLVILSVATARRHYIYRHHSHM